MNNHYGKLGDVWKHLPLAELLRTNPPRHYWETHAGSAVYPLTDGEPHQHGVLRFLKYAPAEPVLQECVYLKILHSKPGFYPGSPLFATEMLGHNASYIFCDLDPESIATLQDATHNLDAQVVAADGVSTIAQAAEQSQCNPMDVLIHIDPFEPRARLTPSSMTPLELAGWLTNSGYRVFYWYGYDTPDRRCWAYHEIMEHAPTAEMWCGDTLIPASFVYPGRSGAWGCGVVLTNTSSIEVDACRQLGYALERICASDYARDNEPSKLIFQEIP
ncbi:MAG: 23S rRNA (adenine(2030)-N(6))-methyltransferase RlmJ [Caldilineaceae bacterium]